MVRWRSSPQPMRASSGICMGLTSTGQLLAEDARVVPFGEERFWDGERNWKLTEAWDSSRVAARAARWPEDRPLRQTKRSEAWRAVWDEFRNWVLAADPIAQAIVPPL